jgi:hypothetical protein
MKVTWLSKRNALSPPYKLKHEVEITLQGQNKEELYGAFKDKASQLSLAYTFLRLSTT